jgi:hypothetical protein
VSADAAMMACPHWQKCSANVCPLDPEWHQRSHADGEPVCFYILESVKPGAEERFEASGLYDFRSTVLGPLPEIVSTWGTIRRTVERAKLSGSRLDRRPPWLGTEKESAAHLGGRAAEGSDNCKSRRDDSPDRARGANGAP